MHVSHCMILLRQPASDDPIDSVQQIRYRYIKHLEQYARYTYFVLVIFVV